MLTTLCVSIDNTIPPTHISRGFEEQQLIPLVGHLFQAAADLLASVNELDSQTQIFSLVNLVVDRLGAEITPHAQGLLSLLPAVWGAAEGQGLLRLQVLVAMTRLINALGMGSPAAYPVLLPMLQYALSLHEGGDVVLLEDGLSLWLVSLRNAPGVEGSGGLLGLLPKLVVIVGQSTGGSGGVGSAKNACVRMCVCMYVLVSLRNLCSYNHTHSLIQHHHQQSICQGVVQSCVAACILVAVSL